MSPQVPSSPKRIVFTGGSGEAGRHVIAKLLTYGHEILNVDVVPLDNPKVHTLKADLTDGAQAFNSLSCHFKVSEPFMEPVQTPDAVVHFAGTCPLPSLQHNTIQSSRLCYICGAGRSRPQVDKVDQDNKYILALTNTHCLFAHRHSPTNEGPRQRNISNQHYGLLQHH